jgi:flagellar basal-body rod modification protein FlgD
MSTSPLGLTAPVVANPAAAPGTSSATSSASTSSSSSSAGAQSAIDALGNPDTFLQLLVAQLQYQDPTSPADGTTFVTQLATFAGVEEQSAMRTDLDSINSVAQQYSASLASAAASTTSSGATTSASTAASTTTSGSSTTGTAAANSTTGATANGTTSN